MQRNYKIGVGDIWQPNLGEAEPITPVGYGAPCEDYKAAVSLKRLLVKDFTCRKYGDAVCYEIGSGRRWHDAPGRAVFGRRSWVRHAASASLVERIGGEHRDRAHSTRSAHR
jgi:hypothetical protein